MCPRAQLHTQQMSHVLLAHGLSCAQLTPMFENLGSFESSAAQCAMLLKVGDAYLIT